jgi:biopolymer transport protein ExbD
MARSFHRREHLSGMSEINVTPLIDLAFALLIIFMITAPLLEQSIDLQLPQEQTRPQPAAATDSVRLSIDRDGQLFWGREAVTWPEFDARLAALGQLADAPVLHVRADATLPYQRVIDVIDRLKHHQLTRISLDTQSR